MSKRSIEVNEEQDRVVSAKTESHSVPAIPASEEQDAPMNDLEEQLSVNLIVMVKLLKLMAMMRLMTKMTLGKSKKKLKL